MQALRFILTSVLVVFLMGCTNEQGGLISNTDQNTEVIQEITKQEEKQIQELTEQIEQITDENHKLTEKILILEDEKRAFFTADQFGRELYHAMVHGDVEKLKQLTTSNLQVFDDRFEQKVSDELVAIPFSGLQTDPHLNNDVIIKTNGFGYDQDKQIINLHYMIIDNLSVYFLNVELFKVDNLKWTVNNVEFDI